jgi:hypothetical protein
MRIPLLVVSILVLANGASATAWDGASQNVPEPKIARYLLGYFKVPVLDGKRHYIGSDACKLEIRGDDRVNDAFIRIEVGQDYAGGKHARHYYRLERLDYTRPAQSRALGVSRDQREIFLQHCHEPSGDLSKYTCRNDGADTGGLRVRLNDDGTLDIRSVTRPREGFMGYEPGVVECAGLRLSDRDAEEDKRQAFCPYFTNHPQGFWDLKDGYQNFECRSVDQPKLLLTFTEQATVLVQKRGQECVYRARFSAEKRIPQPGGGIAGTFTDGKVTWSYFFNARNEVTLVPAHQPGADKHVFQCQDLQDFY